MNLFTKPLALCGHALKHKGVCIACVNRYVFPGGQMGNRASVVDSRSSRHSAG